MIVVWTGRADGGARGGLTGRDAALPLLFDVADLIAAPAAAPAPHRAQGRAAGAAPTCSSVQDGPRLIFPPDGSTVQVEAFGPGRAASVLAAEGEGLLLVRGRRSRLAADPVSGRVVWRPSGPGFYRLTVVDGEGRKARARCG